MSCCCSDAARYDGYQLRQEQTLCVGLSPQNVRRLTLHLSLFVCVCVCCSFSHSPSVCFSPASLLSPFQQTKNVNAEINLLRYAEANRAKGGGYEGQHGYGQVLAPLMHNPRSELQALTENHVVMQIVDLEFLNIGNIHDTRSAFYVRCRFDCATDDAPRHNILTLTRTPSREHPSKANIDHPQSLRDVTTRSTDWKEMTWLSIVEETKVSTRSLGIARNDCYIRRGRAISISSFNQRLHG